MLQLLIIAALTVVGEFSYKTVTLFERTKRVSSAPLGYPATWQEHVETIVSTSPSDREFNAFVKRQAIELQRGYHQDDAASPVAFENYDVAGSLDVDATLIAASPEIISFTIGSGFYRAGMAHPNSDGDRAFTWSRKLNRVLIEQDVFARNRTVRFASWPWPASTIATASRTRTISTVFRLPGNGRRSGATASPGRIRRMSWADICRGAARR